MTIQHLYGKCDNCNGNVAQQNGGGTSYTWHISSAGGCNNATLSVGFNHEVYAEVRERHPHADLDTIFKIGLRRVMPARRPEPTPIATTRAMRRLQTILGIDRPRED